MVLVGRPSPADARRLLDVDGDATADEVRSAFRRRARTAHPDGGGAAERFRDLTAARDVLLGRGAAPAGGNVRSTVVIVPTTPLWRRVLERLSRTSRRRRRDLR